MPKTGGGWPSSSSTDNGSKGKLLATTPTTIIEILTTTETTIRLWTSNCFLAGFYQRARPFSLFVRRQPLPFILNCTSCQKAHRMHQGVEFSKKKGRKKTSSQCCASHWDACSLSASEWLNSIWTILRVIDQWTAKKMLYCAPSVRLISVVNLSDIVPTAFTRKIFGLPCRLQHEIKLK